ncbi:MAG: DUF3570 domain-containing protein [Deltaproteobacteria bacterium]|nr:DUF3570 domain-containing protein [Deltaproteobacteria bacterium]
MAAIKRLTVALSALLVIMAVPGKGLAEDYAAVQTYIHGFDNGVTVYTGVFALNKDLDLDTSTYFKYNVDLINPSFGEGGGGGGDSLKSTGGSVAAVSGASSAVSAGGGSDTRHDLTAGITHNFNNIIGVEAYYDYSREKDYVSNTPTITLKKDLFDKNTTLTIGYSRNMDTISGKFVDTDKSRTTDNYFVGLTQVLSPFTIAQIGYSRNNSRGFESEGIRLVPLNGVDISTCTDKSATCVDEAHPGTRSREAVLFGVNHYFLDGLGGVLERASVKLNLRYYKDDWKIRSYTGEIEYNKYLRDDLILRLGYRYYTQTKAYFVKDIYTVSDALKTSSPQLLALDTHLVDAKLTYLFPKEEGISGVRLGSAEAKYAYYRESIGVSAHIVMLALRLVF